MGRAIREPRTYKCSRAACATARAAPARILPPRLTSQDPRPATHACPRRAREIRASGVRRGSCQPAQPTDLRI